MPEGGVPDTAVGGVGVVPNALALTVMNKVGDPGTAVEVIVGVPAVCVADAVNVPEVIAIRTVPTEDAAFWCGFHNEGVSQASNWVVDLQ